MCVCVLACVFVRGVCVCVCLFPYVCFCLPPGYMNVQKCIAYLIVSSAISVILSFRCIWGQVTQDARVAGHAGSLVHFVRFAFEG